jgi:hypothetical protein
MSNYDMTIHQNPDANAWAKFFLETNPESPYDIHTMRAWFANAMMAMHDHLLYNGAPLNGDHAEFILSQERKNES